MAIRADIFAYVFIAVFLIIVIAAIVVRRMTSKGQSSTTTTTKTYTTPVMPVHMSMPAQPPQIIVSQPPSPIAYSNVHMPPQPSHPPM